MCGPISLALPLDRSNHWTTSLGIVLYTLGRSLGYALLGLIVGLIGVSADLFGALQWLSIASGILIVVFAWSAYYKKSLQIGAVNRWVSQSMSRIFKNKSKEGRNKRLTAFGFVNAFLPCGMVYVALLSAINTGSMANSALFMIVFGIGTLPGFLALGLIKNKLFEWNFLSKKIVVASFVSLVGVVIILRGMNLGIPYISPKMEMMQKMQGESMQEEATISCCSKTSSPSNCSSKN
jgi:sulfite exporter TauE/SafE